MMQLIILAVVLVLIAVRKIGPYRLHIWQIMLCGAAAMLLSGSIAPLDAVGSIDVDVMVFLFGMFVLGQAMEDSGYLGHLSYRIFRRSRNLDMLLFSVIFGAGIASAFLMNDTIAIIGTPVVILLAKSHRISPKVLLLALAFSITIGSVMSPIGNPQNLLIALKGGISNPFLTFMKHLAIPTILNLMALFILLKLSFRGQFHNQTLVHSQEPIRNRKLALVSKISLLLVIGLIAAKVGLVFAGIEMRITYIAVAGAAPILIYRLFSKRFHIMRRVDWYTLIFFASMFIVMESVWQTGFFQKSIEGIDITSKPLIMAAGLLMSQLISNVPLVALYLPLLMHAGTTEASLMALAASSTIAGNLFIMGAASNIIIIQNAERKHSETLTFWEFSKVGIPLAAINTVVYFIFL